MVSGHVISLLQDLWKFINSLPRKHTDISKVNKDKTNELWYNIDYHKVTKNY